jgi:hypothetical protein
VLYDDAFAEQCRDNVRRVAPSFHWDRVLAPLVAFCKAPQRSPDLLDDYARRRLAQSAAKLYRPRAGLRRELEIAREHVRDGGVKRLLHKAASRAAYRTGRKQPGPPQA